MPDSTPPIEQLNTQRGANQLQFFVSAVTRYWKSILVFGIIGSVGFGVWGIFLFRQQPAHVATTTLGIVQTIWESEFLKNVRSPKVVNLTAPSLVRRLRDDPSWSEDVAQALVQQDIETGQDHGWRITPGHYEDLAASIYASVSFVPAADADTVQVRVVRNDGPEAERIANLTARVIVERNRQYVLESEQDTYAFLQQQLEELRQRLDEAESREWEFRKEMGFRTHEQVLADMERLNQQLVQAETAKSEYFAKMEEIESDLSIKNDKLPESLGKITDRVVTDLMAELQTLVQEQLEMRIIYQPEYPGLKMIEDEIAEKEQAVLLALDELDTGQGGTDVWQDRIALRNQYRQLQLEVASLDVRTKTIKRLLNEMVEGLPALAEMSFEHERLVREKEQFRSQFDNLFEKLLEAKTALQRGSNQIERRNDVRGYVDIGAASPVQGWMNFVLGAGIGLIAGVALAMLREWNNTSVRRPEDVTEYLELDLIGTIPLMQFGRMRGRRREYAVNVAGDEVDASIVTKHEPKSPISEAYRSLRTKFQFATIQSKPRTVMVTSSVPAEGKTTTAVNMAVTMADSGMRVLIMDTDLRRPNVHKVLKMDRGVGLADVLREGLDIRSAIRPTRIENLWMVSSGRVPPNPSELIGSERMNRVMARLGTSFDLVICDAPSILVVTDPVLLTKQIDTTLMVVAADYAGRETISRAKNLLMAAGAPIAGVVLNGLEASRRNYYYYYYYYEESPFRRRGWGSLKGSP